MFQQFAGSIRITAVVRQTSNSGCARQADGRGSNARPPFLLPDVWLS
jgi:hypothetical protein